MQTACCFLTAVFPKSFNGLFALSNCPRKKSYIPKIKVDIRIWGCSSPQWPHLSYSPVYLLRHQPHLHPKPSSTVSWKVCNLFSRITMTDILETSSSRIPLSSYPIRKNMKKSYKNLDNSKWVFLLISRVRNNSTQISLITLHTETSICHMRCLNYLASVNFLVYASHST